MATTGQLIRAARACLGITQASLARGLRIPGASNGMVSAWELGRCLPTPDGMEAIARELRTTVESLTGNGLLEECPAPPHIGRPEVPSENQKHNYRSPLTLDGHIPEWIGYDDVKCLVRQWRGQFYDERKFKVWVEVGHDRWGKCPSRIDGLASGTAWPGVRRRKYNWLKVKAWLNSTMYIPDETPGLDANRTVNQ